MFNTEKFVKNLINNRKPIVIVVVLLTLFFVVGMSKIVVDNETMKAVPETLQEKINLKKLDEKFPSPFTLLVLVHFKDSTLSIFDKRDSVANLAKMFNNIVIDSANGVLGTIDASSTKVPVKGGFLGIKLKKMIPDSIGSSSPDKIRANLDANRSLTGALLSEDESIFGMVVKMNPKVDRYKVVGKAVGIVKDADSYDNLDCYITGATAMSYFTSKKMKGDFRILLPLSFLISALLLFLIFRNWMFVIAPLSIIGIAVIWTFGFMGWAGFTFSVVSSVIPVILFPIGLADSIHVLKTFAQHHQRDKKHFVDAFIETYKELLKPILLTSITTFIGFGSFLFSDISWTRSFGIFTGLGVMLALFFTVILLPIFLYSNKKHSYVPDNLADEAGSNNSIEKLEPLRKLLFRSPFAVILFIIVAVISVIGVKRIYFESNPISMFAKNSSVVKSDELISEQFGGTQFFSILLTPPDSLGTFKDTAVWQEVKSIIDYIEQEDVVGGVQSLLPAINRTSQILSHKEISSNGITFLLNGKKGNDKSASLVSGLVTPDYRTTKLQVVCKNVDRFKYNSFGKDIKKHIEADHSGWGVHIAGPSLMIDAMITLLIKTQISSLLTAFISVFLVLMILFKSFRIGLYTTLPIILATVFVYALMGFFNVAVNTVTVIIVNTSIGIGIDYAIHFTSGFLYFRKDYDNNSDALMHTIHDKGGAILFNTIVVGIGFLILILSSFPPIRSFGLFIFISMVVSSLFSIIFLPVLFKRYKQNT